MAVIYEQKKRKRSNPGRIIFAVAVIFMLAAVVFFCVKMIAPIKKMMYPLSCSDIIKKYAGQNGLPPSLVYAVARTESSFNKDAKSKVGAMGIMQITPDTFHWLQSKTGEELPDGALYDPETCVKYGTLLLRMNLEKFGGDETAALAAYHAGRGKVDGWLDDKKYSDDGVKLKSIPPGETEKYVKKVLKTRDIYRELYVNN